MLIFFSGPVEISVVPETSPLAVVSTTMVGKEREGEREGEETSPSPHEETPSGEGQGEGEGEGDSLVEVYSDRLCAVMHAFALCCSVLQKSSKR